MIWVILGLVSVLLATYVLLTMRWLWRAPPKTRHIVIGDEATLFVSDLHIEEPTDVPDELRNAVERHRPVNLVIVGDLFHSPFKVSSDEETRTFLTDMMAKADVEGRIRRVLVTLSENHDRRFSGQEMAFRSGDREVLLTRSPLFLDISGLKVLAVHGDFFSADGFVTAAAELAFSVIGIRGGVERFLRRRFGLDDRCWIVMGHTHIPLIDQNLRVANSGSFHSHFVRSASSTAVLVKDGDVSLVSAPSNR